jgi:hypothetical protein
MVVDHPPFFWYQSWLRQNDSGIIMLATIFFDGIHFIVQLEMSSSSNEDRMQE